VTKREMTAVLYSIYVANLLKDIIYFIIFFTQMLKKKYYPKSILGFQKWTKKMSKNEKGRKTFEKTTFVTEM